MDPKLLVKSSKIVGSAPQIQFRKNQKIVHRVSSWKNVFYEHNARSGGTPAAPRENDLVWRLVVPVPGD